MGLKLIEKLFRKYIETHGMTDGTMKDLNIEVFPF